MPGSDIIIVPLVSARRSNRLIAKKDGRRPAPQHRRSLGATDTERDKVSPLAERGEGRLRSGIARKPYDRPNGQASISSVAPSKHRGRAPRRSLVISPSELVRRESALVAAECDMRRQTEELALKIEVHEKQQQETALLMSQLGERDAQTTLAQLEEHFACPLCYEIASAPYTIRSVNCGHTFCGICVLKWFFSRLHRACGSWHEPVDCPICRTQFIRTPDDAPRNASTFPFVPNRLATTVITALVEKISAPSVNTAMKVKREEREELLVSGSKRPWRKCSRVSPTKEGEAEKPPTPEIGVWGEGGVSKNEWSRKEREGKEEMNRLLEAWPTMQSNGFIEFKARLSV